MQIYNQDIDEKMSIYIQILLTINADGFWDTDNELITSLPTNLF